MLALLLLALALASDAFAVSLVRGSVGDHRIGSALETGIAFGTAQAIMPLAGWALGSLLLEWIAAIDHWIAFGLLGFLGLRMLREGLADDEVELAPRPSGSPRLALLAAAIATSIDAAAAGLTLETFGFAVLPACMVIGVVTAVACVAGFWFAARIGQRLGQYAEIGGGVVLIVLGTNILAHHMGWLNA